MVYKIDDHTTACIFFIFDHILLFKLHHYGFFNQYRYITERSIGGINMYGTNLSSYTESK